MPGKKRIDLTGQKIGRWTVLYEAESVLTNRGDPKRMWHCICECGTEKDVSQASLRSKLSTSCGCYNKEIIKQPNYKNRKKNRYEVLDTYVIGYTAKNEPFYIDKEDLERVSEYSWHYNDNGYVVASMRNGKNERLSRFVMNITDTSIRVDHIGHNLYDNRKSMLRITNASQNTMNGVVRSNNTSGVTGISWDKSRNKWIVSITKDYKNISLGRFEKFEDAVAARKAAEDKYFGEYSYDNSQKIAI